MAYIGRQNLGGAYRQLDDISSGFDGSDTTHTMQVNSQNVTVGDVNQIILSLGGVIQKPGTDFTVSGSVLTFTTAPAANTSFFAILLGSDNGGTVTPTDSSVTPGKTTFFNGTSLSDADLGTGLHIKTGDSGVSSLSVSHDELVVESDGNAGISIIGGTSNTIGIAFGDSGDSDIGRINYVHSDNTMRFINNGTEHMNIDANGHITKPLQPAFLVQPSSTQSDFNQGQSVTVVFGTERFDLNADFASNTFTAPVTGKYRFDISIKINGLSTEDSATYYYWTLVTSNRSYYHLSSVNELGSGSAGFCFAGSILADMDANDTAVVTIIMGGTSGSGPSDVSPDSYWSGNLAC
jgi:hypothetical protein